jgi:hypothetical protein
MKMRVRGKRWFDKRSERLYRGYGGPGNTVAARL